MHLPPQKFASKVLDTPIETEKDVNIFKQSTDPTPDQMDSLIAQLQSTAKKPPQAVPIISDSPSESDKIDSDTSLLPSPTEELILFSQGDLGPIVEPAQVFQDDPGLSMEQAQVVQKDAESLIVEPAQVQDNVQSLVFGEGFDFLTNEETFASGSSSAPSLPEHDAASVKLAKILSFQDSISQSKGKGISIGSGQGSDEDSHQIISELKQEIVSMRHESLEKDFLIGVSERVVRPAPYANLDTFLSSGPSSAQERRDKQARIEELKGKMLVIKHSDQNVSGDHPKMFLRETGKDFTDKL
ncbi:unnamed protein product [Lactuca virosa]|uniref:Uncharacterized protein n=1 Tax=Lactuca virosa TaxID=75947 RepID=A0AAU9PGU9_9ASTR|nr:unnamed protein product [Lactuca virosa]